MLTQSSKNANRRHVHERIRKKILGTAENLLADAFMNVPPVLVLRCLRKHCFQSSVVSRSLQPSHSVLKPDFPGRLFTSITSSILIVRCLADD